MYTVCWISVQRVTAMMCVSASACQLSSYVAVIYLCLGLRELHVHSHCTQFILCMCSWDFQKTLTVGHLS